MNERSKSRDVHIAGSTAGLLPRSLHCEPQRTRLSGRVARTIYHRPPSAGARVRVHPEFPSRAQKPRLGTRPIHSLAVLAVMLGMIGDQPMTAQRMAGEAAGRPKVIGLAYVKVRVTDVEKATAFYGGVLGLANGGVRNGSAVDASFQLNPAQRLELVRTAPGTSGSYLVEIGLATDDLRKMRTYLTAKGVAAGKIMAWPDGTQYFEAQDPEGNKIVFVEPEKSGNNEGATGTISRKMLHAGFVVSNLKAEQQFYENVLGFRLYWRGGFKDDGTDWYEIQVPDGDNWIEFMLNIPIAADHKELGVQNHFSLGVADVKATAEQLRAKGAKEFDGPEVGRDGKDSIDIYDPDGTRVELMEFTPVEKPCCTEYTGAHPKP